MRRSHSTGLSLTCRGHLCRAIACCVGLLLLSGRSSRAQEFTGFGGFSAAQGLKFDSYSWLLDYRVGVFNQVDGSLTWMNEGHFATGLVPHHRDGLALQGWHDLPLHAVPFGVSFGAGPYYFFDSQEHSGRSTDVHRFAPVASIDLKWYFDENKHWLARLRATEIVPIHDPQHLLVDGGIGYYFGPVTLPHSTRLPTWREAVLNSTEDRWPVEWTVLTGVNRINTFGRFGSGSSGTELRIGVWPRVDLTVGYLYEGKTSILRRSGFTGQGWLMTRAYPLCARIGIGAGLGVGAYFNVSAKHQPPGANAPTVPFVAGLLTPSVYLRICDHWTARLLWHRVITSYNTDADVWLVGIGYRFK